jgi:hypothetical protein
VSQLGRTHGFLKTIQYSNDRCCDRATTLESSKEAYYEDMAGQQLADEFFAELLSWPLFAKPHYPIVTIQHDSKFHAGWLRSGVKEWAHFLDAAATPPSKGGEYAPFHDPLFTRKSQVPGT